MQTNLALQKQSSASDEERVDAPTTRFFTSRDAVASDDGCHGKTSLVSDKSQLVSSKRSLDTVSSKTCEAQSSSLSTKDAARMTVPLLEKLTYNSILRSETGRLFSNSMPALGYVHDDKDGDDDDDDNEDDGGVAGRDGGEDRVQWIANMLKQVSESNDVTDDSNNDTLAEEEAAAITAHTDYGYGDGGDAAPSRSLAAILKQPDDAHPVASPVKRRRVTRRNSFVIPRGRGLVAGLLDLQDAGKFDFGTNEHNET